MADILPNGKYCKQTIDGMKKCLKKLGQNWPVSDNIVKNVFKISRLVWHWEEEMFL